MNAGRSVANHNAAGRHGVHCKLAGVRVALAAALALACPGSGLMPIQAFADEAANDPVCSTGEAGEGAAEGAVEAGGAGQAGALTDDASQASGEGQDAAAGEGGGSPAETTDSSVPPAEGADGSTTSAAGDDAGASRQETGDAQAPASTSVGSTSDGVAASGDEKGAQETCLDVAAAKVEGISVQADVVYGVGDGFVISSDEGNGVVYTITGQDTVALGGSALKEQPMQAHSIDYLSATSLTVPSSVTFKGKTYTVTSVKANAFEPYYVNGAKITCGLDSISLPETIESIGSNAFRETHVSRLTIPASVTSIGNEAFAESSLSTVDFEQGIALKSLPSRVFFGAGISSISIPPSVTSIGDLAFSQTYLYDVTIPSTVTTMGYGVFASCVRLKSAVFENGSSITDLPESTFSGCTWLESFDLSQFKSVEASAFSGSALESIVIPKGTTYLAESVFSDCANLKSVTFEDGHELMDVSGSLFSNCTKLSSISLPSTVRTIGDSAFAGCTALSSFAMPASLESLGAFSFSGCTALASVRFTADAQNVSAESSTFYLSNAVKSVVFDGKKNASLQFTSAVPTIYYTISYYRDRASVGGAKLGTYVLAANSIPARATASQVFEGSLMDPPDLDSRWGYEAGFSLAGEMTDSFYAFEVASQGDLKVGDTFVAKTVDGLDVTYTVTAVPDGDAYGSVAVGYADSDASKLAIEKVASGAVTIPASVMGSDARMYSVDAIEPNAFLGCNRIVSLSIPSTVTSIGRHAFARCSSLKNIYFESDARTICDDGIFAGCNNIKRVIFGGKKANVSFGNSSPAIYYTVRYYETKHDKDISHVLSTVIVKERSLLGNLQASQVYSGSIPSLQPQFDWVYDEGFGPTVPLSDSCSAYEQGIGFQATIRVREGNVTETACWFRALTLDQGSKTGTCEVGIDVDGFTAVQSGVSGIPVIPSSVQDSSGNTYSVVAVSDHAFGSTSFWKSCSYITSVDLPSSVARIGQGAFQSCISLDDIAIPSAVSSMGAEAFEGCTALASVKFESASALISIPDEAFMGCEALVMVSLPSGLVSIGAHAFSGCYKAEARYDGGVVPSSGLLSISFPSTLASIGDSAFEGDQILGSVAFPAAISHIGANAFARCRSISTVRFLGNASKVTFGSGVFSVSAFNSDVGYASSSLSKVIFMDKKDPEISKYVAVAMYCPVPQYYYNVKFYASTADFDDGIVGGNALILDDVAVKYMDYPPEGAIPTLGPGMTWNCESGFDIAKRTHDSYYAIAGYDISYAKVSFPQDSYWYTSEYIKPTPTVTWLDGTVLRYGVDYVCDATRGTQGDGYVNNRRGPDAKLFLRGIGDYAGELVGTFSIATSVDSSSSFYVSLPADTSYVYDGTAKQPKPTITATLLGEPYQPVEGVDYTISYENNVDAGSGRVVVRGLGIFGGTYVKTFTIRPMSILRCSVTGLQASYSAASGYAAPTVSLANPYGVSMANGTDFTISYSNNIYDGVGTIYLAGLGNYTGAMAKTFSVYGSGSGAGSGHGTGNGSGNGNGDGRGFGNGTGTGTGTGDGPGAGTGIGAGSSTGSGSGDVTRTGSGSSGGIGFASIEENGETPGAQTAGSEAGGYEGGGNGGTGSGGSYNVYLLSQEGADMVADTVGSPGLPWIIIALVLLSLGIVYEATGFRIQLGAFGKRRRSDAGGPGDAGRAHEGGGAASGMT